MSPTGRGKSCSSRGVVWPRPDAVAGPGRRNNMASWNILRSGACDTRFSLQSKFKTNTKGIMTDRLRAYRNRATRVSPNSSRADWMLGFGVAGLLGGAALGVSAGSVPASSQAEAGVAPPFKTMPNVLGPSFIADAVEHVFPTVVNLKTRVGSMWGVVEAAGSGFIISQDGVVVTNAHVVALAHELPHNPITITLSDGRTFTGHVKAVDKASDIALVQIYEPMEKLPVAAIGRSSSLRVTIHMPLAS